MWLPTGKPFDMNRFTPFEPADVLYDFDGPRIFTLRDADGELNLACWSDAEATVDRYVVVPTTAAEVERLRAGQLSTLDALGQARCWICDIAVDGSVVSCLRVDIDSIPRDALPAAGTMLLPTHPPLTPGARGPADLEPVTLEGRIRELDWDRLSFDLREIENGPPHQTFVFGRDLLADVLAASHAQVRIRVAGHTRPRATVAYASGLAQL